MSYLVPREPAAVLGRALGAPLSEALAMLKLATPIALVALVNMAMSLTDTVMAAAFGPTALAAVAVGSDFYSILFYFSAGVVSGLGPYYAAALAAGDAAAASRLRRIGWLVTAVVATTALPVVWFAPHYLGLLGLDAALVAEGGGYTRAMALTLVPMLCVALFRTRLAAKERPGVLLRVTLLAVPLNAALNYVLMFGIGDWNGYGITGAGISSLVVASFIAGALCLLGRGRHDTAVASAMTADGFMTVLRTGIQIGVTTVAEVGVFLGATLFAATLGAAEAAAHAVAMRTAGIAYALPSGLLQAAVVRGARADALATQAARRRAISTALLVGAGVGMSLFAVLALAAQPGADLLFGVSSMPDTRTMELAVGLLVLVGVMQIFDAPCAAAAGTLRGLRETRQPMIYTLGGYWGVGVPSGLWLALHTPFGVTGVWIGLVLGAAVTSALMFARIGRHWRAADVIGVRHGQSVRSGP